MHLLRTFRPDDMSSIRGLCAADVPRLEAADWAVVAVDRSGSVIGWGSLRSWTEDDGTRVHLTDGCVAPPARRQGLGGRLLREAEAIAARLAAGHTGNGPVVLGGNADAAQRDRIALLERNGYRQVFTMVEMEHDGRPVPVRPLPDGVAVRAATIADVRPVSELAARAWAGRPFSTLPGIERLHSWFSRSDLALFQVATAGERMVGFVAASRGPACTEIEDVQVDPDFQRRGVATAMLTRTLSTLDGAAPIRLRTEGLDPAGARSLYETLGFRVIREHLRYRKDLDGPAPYRTHRSNS